MVRTLQKFAAGFAVPRRSWVVIGLLIGAGVCLRPVFLPGPSNRLLWRAADALVRARYEEAERLARAVLERWPEHAPALLIAGEAAAGADRPEDAAAYFLRVPAASPAEYVRAIRRRDASAVDGAGECGREVPAKRVGRRSVGRKGERKTGRAAAGRRADVGGAAVCEGFAAGRPVDPRPAADDRRVRCHDGDRSTPRRHLPADRAGRPAGAAGQGPRGRDRKPCRSCRVGLSADHRAGSAADRGASAAGRNPAEQTGVRRIPALASRLAERGRRASAHLVRARIVGQTPQPAGCRRPLLPGSPAAAPQPRGRQLSIIPGADLVGLVRSRRTVHRTLAATVQSGSPDERPADLERFGHDPASGRNLRAAGTRVGSRRLVPGGVVHESPRGLGQGGADAAAPAGSRGNRVHARLLPTGAATRSLGLSASQLAERDGEGNCRPGVAGNG